MIGNGNGTKGQGAGVLLAVALPGGADYNNTVEDNTIEGNGQSGVTVHMHAPGQYLDGNVVEGNAIGVNDLTGDHDFSPPDLVTTGVAGRFHRPLDNRRPGQHHLW